MKIPPSYQIFDLPVTLSHRDQDRLGPHLSNWNRLNEILLLSPSETDLRKLVILELMGKQRKAIITRLLPAIQRAERKRIEFKIEEAR